ncbi:MAG: hypothetical protein H7317_07545 [Pseudorhodobacter sp.]|nr:hypothetical protein [Pseudorhodobacter sp.]
MLQAPAGATWLPTEQVLLLSAVLPPLSASHRRAAVGFAVEDRIAQPLEQVFVVLGPVVGGAHVIAVVARGLVAGAKARLLPDVLAVPVPEKGWAVLISDARALVRLADGTGFAMSMADLMMVWRHAGSPEVLLCGGTLPEGMAAAGTLALQPIGRAWARFDLGGADQDGLLRLPRGIWALAGVLVLAAALHLGLIWADLGTERRMLAQREGALRMAMTAIGQPDSGDLDADLGAALAAAEPVKQSGFLTVMVASSAALATVAGVSVQGLSWGEGALRLDLQAPDLAGLQAAEAALTAAGLAVQVGSAVNADGAAKVAMTLEARP